MKKLHLTVNNYVGSPYCWTEMCAGRVRCCLLVRHGMPTGQTDRRTDGRTDGVLQTVTLRFLLDAAGVITVLLCDPTITEVTLQLITEYRILYSADVVVCMYCLKILSEY